MKLRNYVFLQFHYKKAEKNRLLVTFFRTKSQIKFQIVFSESCALSQEHNN